MFTARDYFDQTPYLTLGHDIELLAEDDGEKVTVSVKIAYEFESDAKFLVLYIPQTRRAALCFAHVMTNVQDIWTKEQETEVSAGIAGHSERVDSKALKFTGRVTVWTPNVTETAEWESLLRQGDKQGLHIVLRGASYVGRRASFVSPAAFISHDSRDKEELARPLAIALQRAMCPVWYDEFSLVPGQSLRESIEKGLKECGKCVVILSPHFFANGGWTKREFDSIYTREIVEKKRVIVPIWLNVSRDDVYDYSPILADTIGIPANIGIDEVARRVMRAMDYKPPDLSAQQGDLGGR